MNEETSAQILQKLTSIENRLAQLESGSGETEEEASKPIITPRVITLFVVMIGVILGIYVGLNYVFNHLLDFVPS